jgi:hypothetical protein
LIIFGNSGKFEKMEISNNIENCILETIKSYDGSYTLGNSFEELLSMGELVDRLSIVNFKLYKLKDEVMLRPDDNKFKSWASVEDVKLVRERARLKKCIDEKVISMFKRYKDGDINAGFNPEVKKYGDE